MGKDKPHQLLVVSVQKVRIRLGKGKGKSDGWFPQPLTHNTRRVCTDHPETKLPMHFLCPRREWEREWYGVTTPNIVSGQGMILFPFGAAPPLIGEAEEVVAAEPMGVFRWDPNDLVVTAGDRLVVNHLLEHDFRVLCSWTVFWMILRGCLSQRRHPFSMRTPACRASHKIHRPVAHCMATMGAATTTSTTPTSFTICRSSKGSQSMCLRLRRRVWWGGLGAAAPFFTWQIF